MRPMLLAPASVNQRLPSGPLAMPIGALDVVGMGNWLMETTLVVAPLTKCGVITSRLSKRLPNSTLVTSCARRLLFRARNKLLRWPISTLPSALSRHNMRPTGDNCGDSVPTDRSGYVRSLWRHSSAGSPECPANSGVSRSSPYRQLAYSSCQEAVRLRVRVRVLGELCRSVAGSRMGLSNNQEHAEGGAGG